MTLIVLAIACVIQALGLWLALRLVAPRAAAAPYREYEMCLRAPKCPRVPRELVSGEWS